MRGDDVMDLEHNETKRTNGTTREPAIAEVAQETRAGLELLEVDIYEAHRAIMVAYGHLSLITAEPDSMLAKRLRKLRGALDDILEHIEAADIDGGKVGETLGGIES
jgi:hypothetical protein